LVDALADKEIHGVTVVNELVVEGKHKKDAVELGSRGATHLEKTPFINLNEEGYTKITNFLSSVKPDKTQKRLNDFRVWEVITKEGEKIYILDVGTENTINTGRVKEAKRPLNVAKGGTCPPPVDALRYIERTEYDREDADWITLFATKGPITKDGRYTSMKNERWFFWSAVVGDNLYFFLTNTTSAKDAIMRRLKHGTFTSAKDAMDLTKKSNNNLWVYTEAEATPAPAGVATGKYNFNYDNIYVDEQWMGFCEEQLGKPVNKKHRRK